MKLKKYIFKETEVVSNIIKKMRDFTVLIDNKENVTGIFTEGDFRKAVLRGVNLDQKISRIMNKNFKFLPPNASNKKIKKIFDKTILQKILVLKNRKLVSIIDKDDFFANTKFEKKEKHSNNTIIILAGGEGKRLLPFTHVLPKGLIPIGGEPIIKKIMDEFIKNNFNNFNVVINYKGKVFQGYFHENKHNYNIKFHTEKKALGTAGYLSNFKSSLNRPVFVTNCDILLKANYREILEFHEKNKNELTICSSFKNFLIPYGVFEVDKKSNLKSMHEKPEYNFLINTGFYIFNPKVFKHIPKNKYFNMNYLIQKIQKLKKKIGVFPVPNSSWLDVGQWDEYKKTIEIFKKN